MEVASWEPYPEIVVVVEVNFEAIGTGARHTDLRRAKKVMTDTQVELDCLLCVAMTGCIRNEVHSVLRFDPENEDSRGRCLEFHASRTVLLPCEGSECRLRFHLEEG